MLAQGGGREAEEEGTLLNQECGCIFYNDAVVKDKTRARANANRLSAGV